MIITFNLLGNHGISSLCMLSSVVSKAVFSYFIKMPVKDGHTIVFIIFY